MGTLHPFVFTCPRTASPAGYQRDDHGRLRCLRTVHHPPAEFRPHRPQQRDAAGHQGSRPHRFCERGGGIRPRSYLAPSRGCAANRGERAREAELERGAVYVRYGIYAISPATLYDYFVEKIPPLVYASPAGCMSILMAKCCATSGKSATCPLAT